VSGSPVSILLRPCPTARSQVSQAWLRSVRGRDTRRIQRILAAASTARHRLPTDQIETLPFHGAAQSMRATWNVVNMNLFAARTAQTTISD